jgi:hypothetical protein
LSEKYNEIIIGMLYAILPGYGSVIESYENVEMRLMSDDLKRHVPV